MSIDTLFIKKSHLTIKLVPGTVLLPTTIDSDENVLEVPIVFTPREVCEYKEKVVLDINNGLY
jgi:hypothetical protein